ncbi:hypothetical protein JG687_00002231 [Phytophthora cactorum]|uniref:Mut7-C RNAse domain-containing protein n=1 Tax=Phytophthora cactorum TaxID=29920 RepID=A0A8T1UV25_9STRA|nr:hypothetical protein JG687_00002231 [Phytophthora cactorum]
MELLAAELVETFHLCCNAMQYNDSTADAAAQWTRRIHVAFYGATSTRGSNKFLVLESTLTQVFTHLVSGESAHLFWKFVVQVLLVLAQEPIVVQSTAPIVNSPKPRTLTGKKSFKKCQPNTPLAFLVVNALRRITSGDASSEQMTLCRLEGRNNKELLHFCTKGLGNTSYIDQKLLVELLGLFQINDIEPDLVRNAMEHLLASKSHAALIKLCETFSEVDWPFDTIVMRMVQTKDWTSAELLVRTFEEDDGTALTKVLIDETINLRDFKRDNDLLFASFLSRLLTSPQWLKLGFGFDSDLKVLHLTFPERGVFTTVEPFLDLNTLGLQSAGSLSQCVHHVLGKPMNKDQMNYAALDALCLVHVVNTLYANDDNAVFSERIVKLDHTTSLSEDEVLEAISQRVAYQKKWLQQCAAENKTPCMPQLVTPQDILQIWEGRRSSLPNLNFDTTLKFLTKAQITAMLEAPQEDADTRDFIAVNSICIFINETPSVVCIEANCKLDMAQFARLCGVGRRRVRLATASECRRVFGFTPGTVAPFGHKPWTPKSEEESTQPVQIEVYADSRLQDPQYLAAGSGSPDKVIWIESKAFFALTSINLLDDITIPRDTSCSLSPTSIAADRYSDATEKEPKPLEYKFLADSMVTQVGRWLRTIGVDVVAWNPDDAKATRSKDPKSVMLAYAARDDRIVLTRDTGLPSRRDAGACFVLSDDECYKQFREVKLQFGLLDQVNTRSSRCARCNSNAFSPIDAVFARKKMSERLRKKVPNSVATFWNCEGCGRVYWEGPKYTPAMNSSAESSLAGRVVYRPVPRKRVAGDRSDTRHLPDP